MKKILIKTILLGSLSLVSCKKESSQASQEWSEITTSLEVSQSSDPHQPTRKVWPPVSDQTVAKQTIENYLVVLDDSGSMSGDKMKQAKQALAILADTLAPEHNLGLMLLNDENNVPLDTNNRDAFKKAVVASQAQGGTPLSVSTARAFKLITQQASRQQGYGSYHIIIVTDGQSSDGSPMKFVKKIVEQTSVQVHVVGFHIDTHEMNDPRYVDYRTARNARELSKAFQEVAAETDEFSDPNEFTQ